MARLWQLYSRDHDSEETVGGVIGLSMLLSMELFDLELVDVGELSALPQTFWIWHLNGNGWSCSLQLLDHDSFSRARNGLNCKLPTKLEKLLAIIVAEKC